MSCTCVDKVKHNSSKTDFYKFIWLYIAMPIITPNFDYKCNFAIEVQNSNCKTPHLHREVDSFWVIGKKIA
jgi:hypothetical protein